MSANLDLSISPSEGRDLLLPGLRGICVNRGLNPNDLTKNDVFIRYSPTPILVVRLAGVEREFDGKTLGELFGFWSAFKEGK